MKFGDWLMMITGMIIFMTLVGIDTGLTSILTFLGINVSSGTVNLAGSQFYTTVIVALGVVGTGAIVVGLFSKSYDPSLVITPFIVLVLGIFIKTFISVVQLATSYNQVWLSYLVILIFGVMGVGFVMSGVNYFANR